MMTNELKNPRIRELLDCGLASNLEEAKQILVQREENRRRSDTVFFYTDVSQVRAAFRRNPREKTQLTDESVYSGDIRYAFASSGLLSRLAQHKELSFGKILELVNKKGRITYAAFLKHEGTGILLTPYSRKKLEARGVKSFEKRHPQNVYPFEFCPIKGDYLEGMFQRWDASQISEHSSLVLWIPRREVYFSPKN